MASQISALFFVAAFATCVAAFAIGAWRMARIADRRDFVVLAACAAIMCAGLVWVLTGAVA